MLLNIENKNLTNNIIFDNIYLITSKPIKNIYI